MISFKTRLKETIYERLKGGYPVAIEDLDMAPTPDPKMGDLALTFPFQLAKTLKKAPRAIAQEAAPLPSDRRSSPKRTRSSSSTPTSTRTRPPTSATSADAEKLAASGVVQVRKGSGLNF
ncbi:MAG: hypothetical protein NT006_06480 [Candidatus Aminicenantes bacterium]|nr:hypothetical protein [Candidatus Aminicenantes bacterium]